MHGSFIYDDADAKREDINTVLLEIVLQKYSILLTVQEGLMFYPSVFFLYYFKRYRSQLRSR